MLWPWDDLVMTLGWHPSEAQPQPMSKCVLGLGFIKRIWSAGHGSKHDHLSDERVKLGQQWWITHPAEPAAKRLTVKVFKVWNKLGIEFFTYKTILNIAGGIIRAKIKYFNIVTKKRKRMCIFFIRNDSSRKIKGINNTETYFFRICVLFEVFKCYDGRRYKKIKIIR